MAFPKTRDELIDRGYIFSNHANCRDCRADVEWYETPNGKKIPMDLMQTGSSPAVAHWTTCPNADNFRRK